MVEIGILKPILKYRDGEHQIEHRIPFQDQKTLKLNFNQNYPTKIIFQKI